MTYLKGDSSNELCYMDRTVDTKDGNIQKPSHKVWSCNVCGKGFKYPYTLLRHMPIHTKERKFKCDKCSKAFRQMSTLSQHKATHSPAKPYSCETCGKSFNRGSTLISHRRTHLDIKRFACNICHKAFHQKGNLVNHIYTHTNERPYRCDVCSKGFNQKSNLVCHMYTVHGKKKLYSCAFCPASFSRENAYKIHINSSHRLGAMPVVENDLTSTSEESNHILENNASNQEIENKENDFNIRAVYESCSNTISESNLIPKNITGKAPAESTLLQTSKVVIKAKRTLKKQGLKIPALPNARPFSEFTKSLIDNDIGKMTQNEKIRTNFNMISSKIQPNSIKEEGVFAETIITDMGRNLVVREKPPCVLEQARSKGQTPFLLVVEHGLTPRLCKASLGTEGFIVSPVTSMDIDRLSLSKEFKIPIVMTIKRILDDKRDLKTYILIHQKPIELSILHISNREVKNEPTSTEERDQPEVKPEIGSNQSSIGLIARESSTFDIENSTQSNPESSPKDIISHTKNDECYFTPIPCSESDNMIRLHLSQVAETEHKISETLSESSVLLKSELNTCPNVNSVDYFQINEITSTLLKEFKNEDGSCNIDQSRIKTEDLSSKINEFTQKNQSKYMHILPKDFIWFHKHFCKNEEENYTEKKESIPCDVETKN